MCSFLLCIINASYQCHHPPDTEKNNEIGDRVHQLRAVLSLCRGLRIKNKLECGSAEKLFVTGRTLLDS